MDSDDWIEHNLLENCVKILQDDNLDFVVFGYFLDNENEDKLTHRIEVIPDNINVQLNDRLDINEKMMNILGYAWNKMYKRNFIIENSIRFPKGISLIEDFLFNSKVYLHTQRIRIIDEAYYHYLNRNIPTLIKTFHLNSFELLQKKIVAVKDFFDYWKIQNSEELISENLITGVRYSLHNLFGYKNQLTFKDKVNYIKFMFNSEEVQTYIPYFTPKSLKDKLFKFLMRNKMYYSTSIIMTILK
jgi:hypothetical protein